MNIPEELKYTKEHEWIRIEGDEAVVGITDFAQGELGDIVFVEIETEGEALEQDEVFGSVEAVKTVSDLFMPISGEVISFNEELEENPENWRDKVQYWGETSGGANSTRCLSHIKDNAKTYKFENL